MEAKEQVHQESMVTSNSPAEGVSSEATVADTSSIQGENAPADSSLNTSSSSSPKDYAWVGGVKKEAREKGRQEGYSQAMEEIRQKFSESSNNSQSSPSAPVQSQDIQTQAPPSSPPSYNPEEIATQAAQIAHQQQIAQRYNQIGSKAVAKYGDTYIQKMTEYNQEAQSLAESQDPMSKQWGQQMQSLALMSADIGGEDLVYKLATDENFRNEMLATNHMLWQKKLTDHSINSQPTAQQMASQKVNGAPNENLPNSTSFGDNTQKSWDERRKAVRNDYY